MSNARRILVVDDDDDLRESLKEQLALHDEFDVIAAETGKSVPQIAQDSTWVGLQTQVTAMGLERQRLKEKYRDTHPEIVRIDGLLKGLRQKKDERAAEVIDGGGMFLIAKATHEIHDKLEGEEGHVSARVAPTLAAVITQIMLLDIVFSLDSVITAVGIDRKSVV